MSKRVAERSSGGGRAFALCGLLLAQCWGGGQSCSGDGDSPRGDAGSDAATDAASDAAECSDGFPRGSPGTEARLVARLTPSPEGVTVCPDGSAFVALDASGEVWRVPLDGAAPERWASLGGWQPAGIACDDRGRLFVAAFANRSDATAKPTVLLVSEREATVRPLPGPSDGTTLGGVNGIVAVPGLGVYASDTLAHVVIRVRESAPDTFETTVVARDVSGANGLAYDGANHKLYAAASIAKTLFSFDVGADGTLGQRTVVPTPAPIAFLDGVAVDERGAAYVADFFGGSVIRVTDGASVASVANPASLAFRGGTLLITDYKIGSTTAAGGLYAVELGVCGAAR